MKDWPRRAGASGKDWPRYAVALDMRLAGLHYSDIGKQLEVSKQRAQQLVSFAARQLWFRLFGGPRPVTEHRGDPRRHRDDQEAIDEFLRRLRQIMRNEARPQIPSHD